MILALGLVLALAGCDDASKFPAREGLVNDFAGVLDAPAKANVLAAVEALRDKHQYVLVVVTVKSLHGMSIEDYGNKLANRWGIGKKKEDNGVVFLVAPGEKKVRIEVGYGVEERLTDIDSKTVIEGIVIPRFKNGKIAEGIQTGTQAIAARLGGGVIPKGLVVEKPRLSLGAVILIIAIVLVILIILCAAGGGNFLGGVVGAIASSDSGGGSSSSSDGGGGGGSFGGGGASGSW
jgi:uncharacterized protein